MKAWQIKELGDPWTNLSIGEVALPIPPKGVCRIEVEAVDLNFADILQCQGSYQVKLDTPFTPGMNAVGKVIEVGENSGHALGDRVIGPTYKGFGGYAEECFIPGRQATGLDVGVDPVKAAAMHVTYGTAWFGLHLRGNLQSGETVLVLRRPVAWELLLLNLQKFMVAGWLRQREALRKQTLASRWVLMK